MWQWVVPDSKVGSLGATMINPSLESWQGVVIEAVITWTLVTVVQAATDENRAELGGNAAPVAVGLAIATSHLFAVSRWLRKNEIKYSFFTRVNIIKSRMAKVLYNSLICQANV